MRLLKYDKLLELTGVALNSQNKKCEKMNRLLKYKKNLSHQKKRVKSWQVHDFLDVFILRLFKCDKTLLRWTTCRNNVST